MQASADAGRSTGRPQSRLTLALGGKAAVASAKSAGNTIDQHQGEPGSGLVRFNAWLAGLAPQLPAADPVLRVSLQVHHGQYSNRLMPDRVQHTEGETTQKPTSHSLGNLSAREGEPEDGVNAAL